MGSKEFKKGIITLVILAIGIKLITLIGKGFISNTQLPNINLSGNSIESLGNLLIIGIIIIIVILIPFYLSKRSEEKKYGIEKQYPQK